MSAHKAPSKVRKAYRFIEAHRNEFSIQVMCRILGVARAGYYAWLHQPISERAQEDARLLRLIRVFFIASHGIYGAPRVLLDLRERGETCSKHRVARLMRENGLRALHGYRTRHISVAKPSALIPNLLQRQFTVSKPNAAWVTESFFSSLKKERIKKRIYANRETAIQDVAEYIDGFYNSTRRHSYLGGVSPDEFEATHRGRRSGVH
jgi:transposase InsO family protein